MSVGAAVGAKVAGVVPCSLLALGIHCYGKQVSATYATLQQLLHGIFCSDSLPLTYNLLVRVLYTLACGPCRDSSFRCILQAQTWVARVWASRVWVSRACRVWASRVWASRAWASRAWASRAWARAWAKVSLRLHAGPCHLYDAKCFTCHVVTASVPWCSMRVTLLGSYQGVCCVYQHLILFSVTMLLVHTNLVMGNRPSHNMCGTDKQRVNQKSDWLLKQHLLQLYVYESTTSSSARYICMCRHWTARWWHELWLRHGL